MEGPRGQAWRETTWEAAATTVAPSRATHTFRPCSMPGMAPPPYLRDRWDQGYNGVQYKGWGACRGPLTCWGPGKGPGGESWVELRRRSGCPCGLWEGEGGPSGWKAPSRLSPGNMGQQCGQLCLRLSGLSGPSLFQGAKALASALTSNPCVKQLNLPDNGLCGASVEALAGALSKSSSICCRCGAWGRWAGLRAVHGRVGLLPPMRGAHPHSWSSRPLRWVCWIYWGCSRWVELDPLLCTQCWTAPPFRTPPTPSSDGNLVASQWLCRGRVQQCREVGDGEGLVGAQQGWSRPHLCH